MPKWKYPVTIADKQNNQFTTISSTEEAREFLVSKWPPERSRAYAAALKVCSLDSRIANDVARVSFVLAADEAGISATVETGIKLP